MARYSTRAVLAAAGRGNARSLAMLTHVLDTRRNTVLCKRVKVTSLADKYALLDDGEAASCPTCEERDPRRQRKPHVVKWLSSLNQSTP